jgi:hypothetical protein
LKPVDLGEIYLVGLGAVGNGALWALARTPELSGVLHLIDHETVELSNLQRYVLTTQKDIDEPKVLLAAKQLAGTNIEARPHQQRWGDYLRSVPTWKFERIAVAVDNAEARQAIQAALPKWVVNAWTQPGDLGVSRHGFLGGGACLTCLYFPDEMGQHLDRIVASAIGLPEAHMEIRTLLYTNAPSVETCWRAPPMPWEYHLNLCCRSSWNPLAYSTPAPSVAGLCFASAALSVGIIGRPPYRWPSNQRWRGSCWRPSWSRTLAG